MRNNTLIFIAIYTLCTAFTLYGNNRLSINIIDIPDSNSTYFHDEARRVIRQGELQLNNGISSDSVYVELKRIRTRKDSLDVMVKVNIVTVFYYYSENKGKRIKIFDHDSAFVSTQKSEISAYKEIYRKYFSNILSQGIETYKKTSIEPPIIHSAKIPLLYPCHLGKGYTNIKLHIPFNGNRYDSIIDISFTCSALFKGTQQWRDTLSKEVYYKHPLLVNNEIVRKNEGTHLGMIKVRYAQTPRYTEIPVTITIKSINAMTWRDSTVLGAFIDENDSHILSIARKVIASTNKKESFISTLSNAMALYSYLQSCDMTYIKDPTGIKGEDKIYYPKETLQSKTFDCDDISVLYVNLLESVGIRTSFILYKGHITVAIHGEIPFENYDLIHFFTLIT